MQFASVRLITTDVSALATFYQRVTGAEPKGFDQFLELQIGTFTLAICSEASVTQSNAGAPAAKNRAAILEFRVDDVDDERQRLSDIVDDWVQDPTNQPWGNRSTLFRDPDGNLVNLFTPL
jgi:catechol 2,3-dioxygenase-like lactoylglutathione lyase family enzyme